MQALRHKPPSEATEISGVSAGHDRGRSGCRAGVSNYLTDGNDTYTTDGKFDVILALKGNDKITIQKLFYDVENDVTRITVYGGPGDDQIISKIDISGQVAYGGPGNDTIVMRGGDDLGGAGYGNGGNDTITCIVYQEPCFADGGAGQDTLISQSETSTTLEGGLNKDTLIGGPQLDFGHFGPAGGPRADGQPVGSGASSKPTRAISPLATAVR